MNYPKKLLAQANHSLVMLLALSTENDSCIKLFLAPSCRFFRQFFIYSYEVEVIPSTIRDKGQIYRWGVCGLPIPFTRPF